MPLTNPLYNALPQLAYIQGFWRFEDDFTDLSTNGYTLTETSGTVAFETSGKIGKAADFESDDTEYLARAHADVANLQITGNITISAWVKAESFPEALCYAVAKYSLNSKRAYRLGTSDAGTGDDRVQFTLSNNGTDLTSIRGDTSLSAGTWYHLCGVYNGSKLYAYLNGVSDVAAADYSSGINNSDTPFLIGCGLDGTDNPAAYWDGLIDEVIIWNTALTAAEVARVYSITTAAMYKTGGILQWFF